MRIDCHGWQSRPTDGERIKTSMNREENLIRGTALPSVGNILT